MNAVVFLFRLFAFAVSDSLIFVFLDKYEWRLALPFDLVVFAKYFARTLSWSFFSLIFYFLSHFASKWLLKKKRKQHAVRQAARLNLLVQPFFFLCVCILSFHFFLCVVLMWFINAGSVTVNLVLLSAIVFACVSLYHCTPKLSTSNQKLRKRNGVRVTVDGASVEWTRRRTVEAICNFFFRFPLSGSNNYSNDLLFFCYGRWLGYPHSAAKQICQCVSFTFLSLSPQLYTSLLLPTFSVSCFLFSFTHLSMLPQSEINAAVSLRVLREGAIIGRKTVVFSISINFPFFYTLKSLWHVIAQRR